MKKKYIILIAGVVVLTMLIFACPPLPEIPDQGEPLDIGELGRNFWVRMYLLVMPSPMPNYPALMARDTVWKERSRPHRVKKNLYIAPGVTLTIEPGARVEIDPDVKINSLGRILAEGEKDRPVVITCSDENGHWDLIECQQEWKGRKTDGGETNLFRHCIIERGRGIIVRDSSVRIESCIFRKNAASPLRMEFSGGSIIGNRFYDNSTEIEAASGNGAGIMIYSDREVLAADNELYDNRSVGGRDGGGGIYAFAYDRGRVSLLRNVIRNNYSDRNGGGLVAYECLVEGNRIENNHAEGMGGGVFAIRSRLIDNHIHGNRAGRGGGLFVENSLMTGNLVDDNRAPAASGGGLYYFGTGRIESNTFVRNGEPDGENGETIMISGGPVLAGNNILAHRGHALRIASHSLSPDVNANNNYWGTVHEDAIRHLVFDWLNKTEVGMASWKEFLLFWNRDAPDAPGDVAPTVDPDFQAAGPDFLAGEVDRDMTIGGDAYRIVGNVLVRPGHTLTILPGATLSMAPGAGIRVRGRLAAEGTDAAPIRFTGDPEAPWGVILFENRSEIDDKTPGADGRDKCLLRHCVVEYGQGIQMDGAGGLIDRCIVRKNVNGGIGVRDASARIVNSEIVDNRGAKNGGGIYIYSSLTVDVLSSDILRNHTTGDGGGVFAYGYHSTAAATIENNRIAENRAYGEGGGVWATRSAIIDNRIVDNRADADGGGVFTSFAIVNGNRIANNRGARGGGVFAETNSSLERNRIVENHAADELGGGAYLNFWGVSIRNEVFRRNRVTDNHASGTGGVYLNGAMVFEKNIIHGNHGFQLHNGNLAREESFAATDCFWGTVKAEEIEQAIYDGRVNPRLGTVIYEPFASSPLQIGVP